jgi:RNA-binding protein YhbY
MKVIVKFGILRAHILSEILESIENRWDLIKVTVRSHAEEYYDRYKLLRLIQISIFQIFIIFQIVIEDF